MHFNISNMRQGYREVVEGVRRWGDEVTVRGLKTVEILGASITLTDPTDSLPIGVGRRLNVGIAAVEAAQLIAGQAYPELMCRVSSNFRQFMDGGTFHGAYGTRTVAQLPSVIRRLQDDPSSRQALMTIWDPALDNRDGLHDYPCTISLQFLIREGRLHMQTHMRSNDAWRGLAYDVFQFTQLQLTIARYLNVSVGYYRHYAASLHLYETDLHAVHKMLQYKPVLQPHGGLPNGLRIEQARAILAGTQETWPGTDWDDSTDWYCSKLNKHLEPKCHRCEDRAASSGYACAG